MSIPARVSRWQSLATDVAALFKLDPMLILAIMDRESLGGDALSPKGPEGTGDAGHGRGLMQIDDRAHPDFIAQQHKDGTPLWQVPYDNLEFAARLLKANLDALGGDVAAAVAAYNCGLGRIRKAQAQMRPDATLRERLHAYDCFTTGRDYCSDVLARRDAFSM